MDSPDREDRRWSEAESPEQFRVFEAEGGGCRVEFGRKMLESIRFECSRAMNGVGGLGIGGVLLGTQAGSSYRVFDWRAIPCDHSRGPAFLMSRRDLAGVASFLEGVRSEADARQWKIIGWFASHPRGGLSLSAEERELQSRFFPASGMVLVVHPDRMGDAECAVFQAAEQGAGVKFHVEPLPIQKREHGERRARVHAAAAVAASPDGRGVAGAGRPTRKKIRWIGYAAAAALCGAIGLWMWAAGRPASPVLAALPPAPPIEMLSLHAGPRGGRFVIEWNGQAQAIRFASQVSLLIRDGDRESEVPLSRQDAVAGLQFFRPQSGLVRVTLRLEGARGQRFEEETEYRAEAAPEAAAVPLQGEVIAPAGAANPVAPASPAVAAAPIPGPGAEARSAPAGESKTVPAGRGRKKRPARKSRRP